VNVQLYDCNGGTNWNRLFATPAVGHAGRIKWSPAASWLCFDGEPVGNSGGYLRMWQCSESFRHRQVFVVKKWVAPVPRDYAKKMIHFDWNPDLCISFKRNRYSDNLNRANVELARCRHGAGSQVFLVHHSGRGPIRLAAHPEKCVDVFGGRTYNGVNLQIWDCGKYRNLNRQFSYPRGSGKGKIYWWPAHRGKCFDAEFGYDNQPRHGSNIRVWDCFANSRQYLARRQLFRLQDL